MNDSSLVRRWSVTTMATLRLLLVLFCCLSPAAHGVSWSPETLSHHSDHMEASVAEFADLLHDISAELTSQWRAHMAQLLDKPVFAGTESNNVFAAATNTTGERRVRRDLVAELPHPQSLPELPDTLWHPYTGNTGVGNREVVRLRALSSTAGLSITGPPVDSSPLWQLVELENVHYMFGLFPNNGTICLHIVKTDLVTVIAEHTADFEAADLRVTPHVSHTAHGRQLFLFVKLSVIVRRQTVSALSAAHSAANGAAANGSSSSSSSSSHSPLYGHNFHTQLFCFTVDLLTLQLREVCAPVTVPGHVTVTDLFTGSVYEPAAAGGGGGGGGGGVRHTVVVPLQASRALIVYKLDQLPVPNTYTLSVLATIAGENSVWRARLFSVTGRSYMVVAFGTGNLDEMVQVFRYDGSQFTLIQKIPLVSNVIDLELFSIGFQWYLALAQYESVSLLIWHEDRFHLVQTDHSDLAYKWITVPVLSCRNKLILAKVYSVIEVDSFHPKNIEFYTHNVDTQRFEMVGNVPCHNSQLNRHDFGLKCFEQGGDYLDLRHIVGVRKHNETFIIIPSKLHKLLLVRVDVSVSSAADPVLLDKQSQHDRYNNLRGRIDTLVEELSAVEATLNDAVVRDSDEVLFGNYFLHDVDAESLHSSAVTIGRIQVAGVADDFNTLLDSYANLSDQVEEVQAAMRVLQRKVDDVVYKDDAEVLLIGDKYFTGPGAVNDLHTHNSTTIDSVYDNIPLTEALNNIVTIDTVDVIGGTKTFSQPLLVNQSVFFSSLAGHSPDQLLTGAESTRLTVQGPLMFAGSLLLMDGVTVGGTLNGVHVDQLMLRDNTTHLPVALHVGTLVASSIGADYVNSARPAQLFNVLTSAESGCNFTGAVTIDRLTVSQQATIAELNGVDVSAWLSSLVHVNQPAHISQLSVGSAYTVGSIQTSFVNGRHFPFDNLVLTSDAPVRQGAPLSSVSGFKNFTGQSQLRVDTLNTRQVNDVALDRLVTLDTEQRLASLRVARAHVSGPLTVTDTVNGVRFDLASLVPPTLDSSTAAPSPIFANVVFNAPVLIAGNVQALSVNNNNKNGGGVSGGDLLDLFSHVLTRPVDRPLSSVEVAATGRLVFRQPVTVSQQLTIGSTLNNRPVSELLTLSGTTSGSPGEAVLAVTGSLTVHGSVHVQRGQVLGLVDGVNVTQLASGAIYTDTAKLQTVAGVQRLTQPTHFSRLSVLGTINRVKADSAVWRHTDQVISGPHTYRTPTTTPTTTDALSNAFSDVTAGHVHVSGAVHVPRGAAVAGFDLSELSAYYRHQRATTAAAGVYQWRLHVPALRLLSPPPSPPPGAPAAAEAKETVTVGLLNGLNVSQLLSQILTQSPPPPLPPGGSTGRVVTGHWRLHRLIVQNSVHTLCNANATSTSASAGISPTDACRLCQLANRTVSLSGSSSSSSGGGGGGDGPLLTAPLYISRLLLINNSSVSAPLALSGMPLAELGQLLVLPAATNTTATSVHSVLNMTGVKTFLGGVRVMGAVAAANLPLDQLVTTDSRNVTLSAAGTVFSQPVSAAGGLYVSRPINDRFDIDRFEQLFVTEQHVQIEGDLYVDSALSAVTSQVTGSLLGVNVTHLASQAVPLHQPPSATPSDTPSHSDAPSPITITGHLQFASTVHAPSLHLVSTVHHTPTADGGAASGATDRLVALLSSVRRVDSPQRHYFNTSVYGRSLRVEGPMTAERLVAQRQLNTETNLTALLHDLINCSANLVTARHQPWLCTNLIIVPDPTAPPSPPSPPAALSVDWLNGVPFAQLYVPGRTLQLLRVMGSVQMEHAIVSGGAISAANAAPLSDLPATLSSLMPLCGGQDQLTFGAERLVFSGDVTFAAPLVTHGSVAGINVSRVVTKDNNNITMTGNYVFDNVVHVHNLTLHSLVDGINVSQCLQQAVYPDQDTLLQGHYRFKLISSHMADDGILSHLNSSLYQARRDYFDKLDAVNSEYIGQCRLFSRLYTASIDGVYEALHYFDSVQELRLPNLFAITALALLPTRNHSEPPHVLVSYLRATDGCAETRLLRWHANSAQLRPLPASVLAPNPGEVGQWSVANVGAGGANGAADTILVAVSSADGVYSGNGAHCANQLNSSAVWRWNNQQQQLELAGSLNAVATSSVLDPSSPPIVYLLNSARQQLKSIHLSVDRDSFAIDSVYNHPEPVSLFAVHWLADDSRLLVTATANDTLTLRHVTSAAGAGADHVTRLGSLRAVDVHWFVLRRRHFMAVADMGWSSLLGRPQGIKIFEYVSDTQHRCLPVQHLSAVDPRQVSHFSAGSVPDFFLLAVEKHHGVIVFIDQGEAGFVEFQRLAVPGAAWARVFHTELAPHLLIATEDHLLLLRAQMVGSKLAAFNPSQCDMDKISLV